MLNQNKQISELKNKITSLQFKVDNNKTMNKRYHSDDDDEEDK